MATYRAEIAEAKKQDDVEDALIINGGTDIVFGDGNVTFKLEDAGNDINILDNSGLFKKRIEEIGQVTEPQKVS